MSRLGNPTLLIAGRKHLAHIYELEYKHAAALTPKATSAIVSSKRY
jgi:hypothetical protein